MSLNLSVAQDMTGLRCTRSVR